MKFRFYHIEDDYISFLHKKDNRVQWNKNMSRPYIGIVLTVNGKNYFAPLESPKSNHVNIKSGGPVLKLDNGKLGIIGFNNMIPVKKKNLIEFDIQSYSDERYKILLIKQLAWCQKNSDVLLRRAQTVYQKATEQKQPFYIKTCCDFKKLEHCCNIYRPRKEESVDEN